MSDFSINMDLVCAGIENKEEEVVFPKETEGPDIRTHVFRFPAQCLLNTKYWTMIMHQHPIFQYIPY